MAERIIFYDKHKDVYKIVNKDNGTEVIAPRKRADEWMMSNLCLIVTDEGVDFQMQPIEIVQDYGLSQNELRMMVVGLL
jgi:hypothetical protein